MKVIKVKKWAVVLAAGFMLLTLSSCTSPEQKTLNFFESGMELYEQGELAQAKLEFRNALQIDPKYADAYFMMGKLALKEEQPRVAYGNFVRTIEIDPENYDAQIELAQFFLASRDIKTAKEKVEAVLAVNPQKYNALLLKATIEIIDQKMDLAFDLLKKLTQHPDVTIEAYELLAMAYDKMQLNDKVEETLKQGVTLFPDSISTWRLLSKYYLSANETDKAITALQKISEIDPKLVGSRLQIASIYMKAGDEGKGLILLQEIIDINPEKEENWVTVADFLLKMNMNEKAESYLRKGLERNSSSFLLRFSLGRLYVALNRIDDAIEITEQCLTLTKDEQDPNISETYNNLANIYIKIGEIEQATEAVRKSLESNPKSVEAHLLQGDLFLLAGHPDNAIAEYRVVTKEKPEFISGRIRLAEAHMRNKQPELAKDTVQQALSEFPGDLELVQSMDQVYIAEGNVQGSIRLYRDLLDKKPENQRIRSRLGDLYLMSNQTEEAKLIYKEIITSLPKVPAGYLKLAQLYQSENKSKQAIVVLKKGLARMPDSTTFMDQIVQIYLDKGQYRKATAFCRKQMKRKPDNPYLYNLLGLIQMRENNFIAAEGSFNSAVQLNDRWLMPLNNLAAALLLQGKKEQAITRFSESLEANPRNPALYGVLGKLYEQAGDWEKAASLYEKGLKELPTEWSVANNYAYLLAENSESKADLQRAYGLAQKALRLTPENPLALDTVGWVLYHMEDYPQAAEFMEKALVKIKEGVAPPELLYHHGMVMFKSGQIEQAIHSLQLALVKDDKFPGRDEAQSLLNTLQKKG